MIATAACIDGKLIMPLTASKSIVPSILSRKVKTISAVVRPNVGRVAKHAWSPHAQNRPQGGNRNLDASGLIDGHAEKMKKRASSRILPAMTSASAAPTSCAVKVAQAALSTLSNRDE